MNTRFLPMLGAAVMLASSAPLLAAESPPRSGNAVFDRTVALVEKNFYDPDGLGDFVEAVALTVDNLPDLVTAEPEILDDAIDFVLASLDVSHTGRFVSDEVAYYELVNVFRFGLRERVRQLFPPRGTVTYEGIGITSAAIDGRRFVTDVYSGGPADEAGLLMGDEILAVDGAPFAEIDSFRDKAGGTARLTIRRAESAAPTDLVIPVATIAPAEMFPDAIADSVRIIDHDGDKVGYLRIWAYTERQVRDVIEQALVGELAAADGLVLDLRSRWGGAPPDAVDSFLGGGPDMTMVFRDGEPDLVHARWRKPLVAIIDEGTRSGMEILAHALKSGGVPLIGSRSAGDVLAGRAYWLPDDSLLEIAVADVFVDGIRLEGDRRAGAGVTPDIVVPFDIRYAGGADPQLDIALDALARRLDTNLSPPGTP